MVFILPHMKQLPDGLLQMLEIICPIPAMGAGSTEANCAVQEALNILQQLGQVQWQQPQMSYVTIYLSKILHFSSINNHYCEFVETFIPSLHTCDVVGKFSLPVGFCVLLDCLIQCGSSTYLCLSKDHTWMQILVVCHLSYGMYCLFSHSHTGLLYYLFVLSLSNRPCAGFKSSIL